MNRCVVENVQTDRSSSMSDLLTSERMARADVGSGSVRLEVASCRTTYVAESDSAWASKLFDDAQHGAEGHLGSYK